MFATIKRSVFVMKISGIIVITLCVGCGRSESTTPKFKVDATDPTTGTAASTGEWPRWGGPNLDLISTESDWSSDWPGESLPEVWKTSIGIGFSSVAISDGRLFASGHRDRNEYLFCLDPKTGTELWSIHYPCALVDNLHEGGSGATPTIAGPRGFAFSREGELRCFNVENGEQFWLKDIPTELGVEMPEWGFTASPLVINDKVILEAGRLAAWQVDSGEKVWQTELYPPGYGSAVAFESGDETLVATLNNEKLLVVRPEDGKEVASTPWTTKYLTSGTTPIVAEDTLFVSTGYRQGCGLFQLADGQLREVYRNKEISNHMNNCVLRDGFLYGIDGQSNSSRNCSLVCMDYQTGEKQWEERGYGCGSLMLAGDRLLVLSDDGTLAAVKASPEAFGELARAKVLEGRCWTVPVLLDGLVYCRNAAGDLVCVQLPN